MTFTLEQWRKDAHTKYKELSQWLGRGANNAGLAAYGALASMTFWPAVEYAIALAQIGQPLPMSFGIVLASVAGNVGSNLLASQIDRWHQAAARGDAPTEADVLDWLAENVLTQEEVRLAVDDMLERLEAIPAAQTALPADEWVALAQQLHTELARLGSLPRFAAALIGDGAVAQGANAKALGQNAIDASGARIGGGVNTGVMQAGGDMAGRDLRKKIKAQTYIEQQNILPANEPDETALRAAYLHHLLHQVDALTLAGIDPRAASDEADSRLHLGAVYTALLTQTSAGDVALEMRPGGKSRRLSALEMLNQHKRLVLLGDPGSGKSTFVRFVALCLAGEWLKRPEANLTLLTTPLPDEEGNLTEQKQPWTHGALLPVVVTLREFAARGLPAKADETATAQHLWDFIAAELTTATLADYTAPLQQALREEGGLLLLDGLDEVPEADQRRLQIRQAVEAFAAAYPLVHILVTGRTYAYQKQAWQLRDFNVGVLSPFAAGQIRQFVNRWYAYMAAVRGLNREDAQGRAELLKRAIFHNPRLQELAERPLLLTLMASLHAWRGGSLPEKREELYADAVDLLLDWWEKPKTVRGADGLAQIEQPSLAEWLWVDRKKVREFLHKLAYEAHAAQPELVDTADIPESELTNGLLALSENPDVRPRRLVDYLSHRAGLLVPRGVGVYTFPHRTFQEYLAACYLTDDDFPDKLAELARNDPDRWREVALLAGAKAARGSAATIWQLADALCYEETPSPDLPALWGARLAGQALAETAQLGQIPARHQPKAERLQRWLPYIMRGNSLPALERALAAQHLAQLGDPRPEAIDVDAMQFCYVPAGPFWMGSAEPPQTDDSFIQELFDAEKPLHQLDLPHAYWLGRYPVTNAQYAAFVNAGGYEQSAFWPEARQDNLWRDGRIEARTWIPEKRDVVTMQRAAPYDYGDPFNLPNHPVAGVTWYEALAFCRWLTARWRQTKRLPPDWSLWPPSEAEWEKGARGGLAVPAQPLIQPLDGAMTPPRLATESNKNEQRQYPWGDEAADSRRANYAAADLSATTGVGCFAAGASPYGCEEMSGNIFEWTRSQYQPYPYDTQDGRESLAAGQSEIWILRGGSWGVDRTWLRCASRSWLIPLNWGVSYGFRVCASPFSIP